MRVSNESQLSKTGTIIFDRCSNLNPSPPGQLYFVTELIRPGKCVDIMIYGEFCVDSENLTSTNLDSFVKL